MSVAQLGQHVAQYLEEPVVAHIIRNQSAILAVDGIPVNPFVIKEAVLLVDYLPESFKVASRGVVVGLFANAPRREEKHQQGDESEGTAYEE